MMIAIDGPAGAGKSEISRGLAAKLGFAYLDTGAMYRAIGLKAMRLGAPLDEESSLAAILDNTALEVHCSVNGAPVILLDGENVTDERGLLLAQLCGRGDVGLRNNKEMLRCQRLDVIKRQALLVLIQLLRGDLACQNAAENAVVHHFPPRFTPDAW